MEQLLAAAVVVLFVAFLLWNGLVRAPLRRSARQKLSTPDGADEQLRELLEELRNGAQTRKALERIKKRVAAEPSPKVQAVYLCAAGDVLRNTLSRRATAVRYYLKALKTDPACIDARHGLRDLLLQQRRGFKLEQVYWRLLEQLDFESNDTQMVLEIWSELATLLERRRSGKKRAAALRHLIAKIDSEGIHRPDCEDEID